ncbi:hypothetical protein DFJ63DRAFT_315806 [Scheffersomyces coipomensis]|uniref:uncharacterized protein n=1 Tax=Scheffersomyces coipomensis TaxID=1788519 RepID=UPI00315DC226
MCMKRPTSPIDSASIQDTYVINPRRNDIIPSIPILIDAPSEPQIDLKSDLKQPYYDDIDDDDNMNEKRDFKLDEEEYLLGTTPLPTPTISKSNTKRNQLIVNLMTILINSLIMGFLLYRRYYSN